MKTTFLSFLLVLFWINLFSQTPQAFKYQSVVRNLSGQVLTNKAVTFRISILQGSATGTVMYSELHSKTTNDFGLADMEIGKGTPVSGSFGSINWGTATFFMKVEIDPAGGTNYQAMGTSQLVSVPYALFAKNVEIEADGDPSNEIQTLSLSGAVVSLSKGGGSVTVPSADNWGTEYVHTDATLAGTGTVSSTLKIADNGVNSVKILDGSVATADLADNAITSAKIADLAVGTTKIANSTVTAPKLASMGASAGQVLKWNGTSWAPAADDNSGGGGLTLPYTGSASSVNPAFSITNSTGNAIKGLSSSTSGTESGVFGETYSLLGKGVYGKASASMGQPFGVYGEALTGGGTGVFGKGGNYGLYGETTSENGIGLYAQSTSSVGNTKGVHGFSNSETGIGVYGKSATGVYGISNSDGGKGVEGISNSTSGLGSGVFGETYSVLGKGVYGKASSSMGQPFGVYGEALTEGGTGVFGKGGTYGLYGETTSENGTGLYAQATSAEGHTTGVKGFSNSTSGIGVVGESSTGVFGQSNYGTGVWGKTTDTVGSGIGVLGESSGDTGAGLWGRGKDGVVGQSVGDDGSGVFGVDITGGGEKYGVRGLSYSATGSGVFGRAMSLDGICFGVKGLVSSNNGFSGHFSGGKFYISGNTGLGTENPATKLHVLYNSSVHTPQLLLEESELDYARLSFKNTGIPTKSWSVAGLTSTSDANSRLNFYYFNGSNGTDVVTVTGDGKVGIGTFNPQANLNVVGTAQVGAAGKPISEIKEITGVLPNGGIYTFAYPSGYTNTNMRVLAFEIFVTNRWYGPSSVFPFEYTLFNDYIQLTYYSGFYLKNFRLLIMKVE
jgi:trimeric autotransporter adhesin